MVKYRTLTSEELKIMEKDFVQFLVVNGIMANDWELLKVEEPKKAQDLIDMFSDIVMEKALGKIEYLQKNEKTAITCIAFGADKMKIFGLVADEDADVDFTNKETIQSAVLNPPKGLKVVTKDAPYIKTRSEDIFVFLSQGYEISNGKFFQALALSQKQTLN